MRILGRGRHIAGIVVCLLIGIATPTFALPEHARDGDPTVRAYGAPEISPGLLTSGILLLVGGTLVLLDTRRKPLFKN